MNQLASALTSPEVLPWITGSGGALVVLFLWVQAERSDKRDLRKECSSWRASDANRSEAFTALLRECTSCITKITEQFSHGNNRVDSLLDELTDKVSSFRCNANSHRPEPHDGQQATGSVPRRLQDGV